MTRCIITMVLNSHTSKMLYKNLLLALTICLVSICLSAQQQSSLQIKVEGVKKIEGEIRVCLNQTKSLFPDECEYGKIAKVMERNVLIQVDGIANGKYAVSLFHDENMDGVLNKNLLGIPKEKYGFSNNPNSTFGVPDFEDCLVEINGETQITIKI